MKPDEVREILMVQCVEQTDDKGHLVSIQEKTESAATAGAPLPRKSTPHEQHTFLVSRAQSIITRLISRFPESSDWLLSRSGNHRLGIFTALFFITAAVSGFLTNELGPDKRINILSFPLLAIIAWNLAVYLREVIQFIRHRGALFGGFWIETFVRLIAAPEKRSVDISTEKSPLEGARKLFDRRWFELQFPVIGMQIKSALHFAALILASGAIGGMYVQGLANEYRAVWESTFISEAEQILPILQFVLGPAVALSGEPLPSVAELNAMHWQSGTSEVEGESAARWIHWYAISIGLFVVLPRSILGFFWKIRGETLKRNLPYLDTCPHYFDHLLAVSTGDSRDIKVIPYSLGLNDELQQTVLTRLEETLQCPVAIDWLPTVAFGNEETPDCPVDFDESPAVALLFNFASTPERETHLVLHHSLSNTLDRSVDFLILDTSTFEAKSLNFPDADKRLADRLSAWQKLFSETNVEFVLTGGESVPSSSSDS